MSTAITLSRPCMPLTLPSQQSSPIVDLLNLQILAEELMNSLTLVQAEELKNSIRSYETLSIELIKKQQELADKQENASYWDSARQFVSTWLTALTFCAAEVAAPGGLVAARLVQALLISGSSLLINQGLAYSGGWQKLASFFSEEKETQEKIASVVEKIVAVGATFLGSMSLGSFANTVPVTSLAFWTQPIGTEKITSVLSDLVRYANIFLGLKSGIDTSKTYEMQKEVKQSTGASSLYKYRNGEITQSIQKTSDNLQNLNETCTDAVRSYFASLRLAAQSA